MRNLANQLFEHKEIKTTTAKAKEARSTVERLITYAKKNDLHHRRLAFRFLRRKSTIMVLFDEIAPTFTDRQGGYTRVIKLGKRLGDGAPMSILQLVGFETLGEAVKADKKKKTVKKAEKSEVQEKTDTITSVEEPAVSENTESGKEKKSKKESKRQPSEKQKVAKVKAEAKSIDLDKKAELKKETEPKKTAPDQQNPELKTEKKK
jgi:large subunit ribosomal protein L17